MPLAARAPVWGKSMARFLPKEPSTASMRAGNGSSPIQVPEATPSMPEPRVLAKIGLSSLGNIPSEPRLLLETLKTDDATDGATSADDFSRGIRRAVRLHLAFRAKLHRRENRSWREWVSEHFQAGYSCYQRYRIAAELQLGLLSRGLPALSNEFQARSLAPLRRHAQFWEKLADEFKEGFPAGEQIRPRLEAALGILSSAAAPARVRLHRALTRILAGNSGDVPGTGEALALVRRALALLETGE